MTVVSNSCTGGEACMELTQRKICCFMVFLMAVWTFLKGHFNPQCLTCHLNAMQSALIALLYGSNVCDFKLLVVGCLCTPLRQSGRLQCVILCTINLDSSILVLMLWCWQIFKLSDFQRTKLQLRCIFPRIFLGTIKIFHSRQLLPT